MIEFTSVDSSGSGAEFRVSLRGKDVTMILDLSMYPELVHGARSMITLTVASGATAPAYLANEYEYVVEKVNADADLP